MSWTMMPLTQSFVLYSSQAPNGIRDSVAHQHNENDRAVEVSLHNNKQRSILSNNGSMKVRRGTLKLRRDIVGRWTPSMRCCDNNFPDTHRVAVEPMSIPVKYFIDPASPGRPPDGY